MDLTPAQQRTVDLLIGRGPPPVFDTDLAERVRSRLEAALRGSGIAPGHDPLWLGKSRLNEHQRCEGLFQAALSGEGPGFEHSVRTAIGSLFPKAIEIDVTTERAFDPHSVCERAAVRLSDGDASFAGYWSLLDAMDRAEHVAGSGRQLALFRDSFPPLPRRWAPQPELRLRVRLIGGAVVLSGTPDLVLGRTRRLVFDFKTGRAWPEHPEDMRFYALLLLLRTGVPPYRVATFFLDSGEWQAEDVDEAMLTRAADRVVMAAASAVELRAGRAPRLTGGGHCRWCPRRSSCPAVSPWFGGEENRESSARVLLLPHGSLAYGSAISFAPTETGATLRSDDDGEGLGRDRTAPPAGPGPPRDVRAGHPARAIR
jgi:PD-(D/E)XK nuclease superfamily protein